FCVLTPARLGICLGVNLFQHQKLFMKNSLTLLAALLAVSAPASLRAADDKVPLKLDLPAHTLKGTPEDLPSGPNVEPLSDKPRPAFPVPKGVVNVAAGKTVTSSITPFLGDLKQI